MQCCSKRRRQNCQACVTLCSGLLPQSSLGGERRELGQPLYAQTEKEPLHRPGLCSSICHLYKEKEKEHLSSSLSFLDMSTHFHLIPQPTSPLTSLCSVRSHGPTGKCRDCWLARQLWISPWSGRGGFRDSNFPPDPGVWQGSHSIVRLSPSHLSLVKVSTDPHCPEASSSLTCQPISTQLMTPSILRPSSTRLVGHPFLLFSSSLTGHLVCFLCWILLIFLTSKCADAQHTNLRSLFPLSLFDSSGKLLLWHGSKYYLTAVTPKYLSIMHTSSLNPAA